MTKWPCLRGASSDRWLRRRRLLFLLDVSDVKSKFWTDHRCTDSPSHSLHYVSQILDLINPPQRNGSLDRVLDTEHAGVGEESGWDEDDAQLSFYSKAQMTIHRAVLVMTALKKEKGTRVPYMHSLCFSKPGAKLLVKASEAFWVPAHVTSFGRRCVPRL